jgi:Zeta toxin
MNLAQTIELFGTGTSEGAYKAWEVRQRGGGSSYAPSERMSKEILDREKTDPAFNDTLDRLRKDNSLTAYERENIVPLARAYTEAAKNFKDGKDSTQVYAGPYGGYSKERSEWHSEVIAAYESKFGPPQAKPIAIITGGLAGAGKTANLRNVPGIDKFVQVNADDIKEAAPEYNGYNAAFLHEESDDVARAVLERAVNAKQHVVVDITMKSGGDPAKGFNDSLRGKIAELSKRGYEVHLMFSDVTIEESVKRAMERYGNPKNEKGRFVPPAHIKKSVSAKGSNSVNFDNFMEATKLPEVAGWKLFDNMGAKPVLKKSGGRDFHAEAEKRYRASVRAIR